VIFNNTAPYKEIGQVLSKPETKVIVGLPMLAADTSFQYKEIRRDPAKMLQLEWDGAKYEGYGPKVLKKVESFTPAPHTRPVYANFFGFEIENNAIEK
jgi:hypothetical protein